MARVEDLKARWRADLLAERDCSCPDCIRQRALFEERYGEAFDGGES